MKIKTITYRTLSAFVSACHKNRIRIVKVSSDTGMTWLRSVAQSEVRVTAFSRRSPVLRVWEAEMEERAGDVVDKLYLEGFCVVEGEWDKNQLPSLLDSLNERNRA